tara:strand:+ start:298 stop:741 length:444 start_codon:yes stop_codon:yes gene_type:complete
MSEVTFNKGRIPETRLPGEDPLFEQEIKAIRGSASTDKRSMLLALASKNPESIGIWCVLGISSFEMMESYSYFRVAYHRGLDSLRKNGWRGSGFVRWEHVGNRYFLFALNQLAEISKEIGDHVEAERCSLFLRQLEPGWEQLQIDSL